MRKEKVPFYQSTWFIILMTFFCFFPLGLFLMWKYKKFSKPVRIAISAFFVVIMIASLFGSHKEIEPETPTVLEAASTEEITIAELTTVEETTIPEVVEEITTEPESAAEETSAEETAAVETTVEETTAAPETSKATFTYVLNKSTKKFHRPSCGSVSKIKEKNRGEFEGTRDEIVHMGYDPCGNCKP